MAETVEVTLHNGKKVKINKLNLENYQAEVRSANKPTELPEITVTAVKRPTLYDKFKESLNHLTNDFLGYIDYKNSEHQADFASTINRIYENADRLNKEAEAREQSKLSDPNFIHKVNLAAADAQVRNTAFTDDKTLNFWLNAGTPSLLIGAVIDGFLGGGYGSFVNSLKNGNSGFVSDNFYKEHPTLSSVINFIGDGVAFSSPKLIPRAVNYGYTKLVPKDWLLAREMNLSLSGSSSIPFKPYMQLEEFKFDPSESIVIHADRGDFRGAFTGLGAYVRDEMLHPGLTRVAGLRNFTWWNENELFSPGFKTKPFARIFLSRKSDIPGLLRVREMNEPVGQWRPGSRKAFVRKSEMVTPEPTPISRMILYNLDPYESSLGNNLYVRSDIPTTKVYGLESLRYRDPTQFQQGVRTSGTRQTIGQGPITGSRNVDNPSLPGPINYHPSRITLNALQSAGETLHLQNYQKIKSVPRGKYMPEGILFDRVTDYTEGFRPSIVRRWVNPENGRNVFDWISIHDWPMESPSGKWLSNKESNWMWTDLLIIPVTLYHRKGGKLNEKE